MNKIYMLNQIHISKIEIVVDVAELTLIPAPHSYVILICLYYKHKSAFKLRNITFLRH